MSIVVGPSPLGSSSALKVLYAGYNAPARTISGFKMITSKKNMVVKDFNYVQPSIFFLDLMEIYKLIHRMFTLLAVIMFMAVLSIRNCSSTRLQSAHTFLTS